MTKNDHGYSSFLNPCESKADKIHALLSGDLPGKEEAALESHLESCAACRDFLDFMNRLNDDFRGSFEKEPGAIPPGLPKQIREDMGIALQESLADWLMESGKTLFLTENGRADCVNYKTAPLPISKCRFQMEKILQALAGPDGAAGPPLETGFLQECRRLCLAINPEPPARPAHGLIKECFDRSLFIKPDVPEVMNLLGSHHYIEKDPDSAIKEFRKVLNLDHSRYTRYATNINLASSWHVKFDAEEAFYHLSEAQKIRDDGLVNFNLSLLQIYRRNDPTGAYKHLKKMDQWIQVEREFVDVSRMLSIITGMIREYYQSMSEFLKDSGEAVQLIRKYRDPIGICP